MSNWDKEGFETEIVYIGENKSFRKYVGVFLAILISVIGGLYIFSVKHESSFFYSITKTIRDSFSDTLYGNVGKENLVEVIDLKNSGDSYLPSSTEEMIIPDIPSDSNDGNEEYKKEEQRIQDFFDLNIVSVIYDVDGADEGNERIIILNKGDTDIDLSYASLQYVPSSGDFIKIKKRNFEAGNIILSGKEFVIGANCHFDTPCVGVDLSWSEALNNTSGTIFIVRNQEQLIGVNDPDIIDLFLYPA
jgi:hypothetical protein